MRLSLSLWSQHKGRMINRHWYIQGRRVPIDVCTEKSLIKHNIPLTDALDVAYEKPKLPPLVYDFDPPLGPIKIEPELKDRICLTYFDHNLLTDGVSQAQLLTKTIQIEDKFPKRIEELVKDHSEEIHKIVKRTILTSTIFDAHQEKLPKKKDPNRPAFNFPRIYGLTNIRKIRNLSQKWTHICDSIAGPSIAYNRSVINNAVVSVPIEKDTDLLQFTLTMDLMISSPTPLSPIMNDKSYGIDINLPSIFPLHHAVGLDSTKIYKGNDIYPIDSKSPWVNVHTIFVHHDEQQVRNLTKLPVREDQILARSLIKSFSVAAACARQKFGVSIKDLPEPITVQCIQSNGKLFHFSVFQLNTLNLDGIEGVRNFWWSMPHLQLYEKAQYERGRPTFEGYNPEIFNRVFAFYSNN